MVCLKCGADNDDANMSCFKCGFAFNHPNKQNTGKHGKIFQFWMFVLGMFLTWICSIGIADLEIFLFSFICYFLGLFLLWKKSFYFGKGVYIAYWVAGIALLIWGLLVIFAYVGDGNAVNVGYVRYGCSQTTGGVLLIFRAYLHKKWGMLGTNGNVKFSNSVYVKPQANTQRTSIQTVPKEWGIDDEKKETMRVHDVKSEDADNSQKRFSMEDIDRIAELEGKKQKGDLFEHYCAKLLELNMFSNVMVTGGSGDLGADIIAWKAKRKYVIQCKCYSTTVPYHALEQAATARRNVAASQAILLTNNYFSAQTKRMATEHQVILWDRDALSKLIDNANAVLENSLDKVN